MNIEFRDPPPIELGPPWREIADALRARPNDWAAIKSYASRYSANAVAQKIKHGCIEAFPAGEFEATVRNIGGGRHELFVRFIGAPAIEAVPAPDASVSELFSAIRGATA